MAHVQQPGVADNDDGRFHVQYWLGQREFFLPGWSYLSGGMETVRAPFLLLAHENGARLFLLERRDGDGEWAPKMYAARADLDPGDSASVLFAISRIGTLEEVSRTDARLLTPPQLTADFDPAVDALSTLLFVYRDIISPGALTARSPARSPRPLDGHAPKSPERAEGQFRCDLG